MTERKPLRHNESTAGGKPMRSDARRNRERLLAVADEVFMAEGTSVSTEEIAKRAGVGVGTLFRHFPTKEGLLEAVFVGRLRQLVDRAEELAANSDPANALFTFFAESIDISATKNAYADALSKAGIDIESAISPVKGDLFRTLGRLLANARRAGAVRANVEVPELLALLVGTSRAVEQIGANAQARKRIVEIVLAGLRAS